MNIKFDHCIACIGFDIWIRNTNIRPLEWYLQAFDKPAKEIKSTIEDTGNINGYHPLITGELYIKLSSASLNN